MSHTKAQIIGEIVAFILASGASDPRKAAALGAVAEGKYTAALTLLG